MKLRTTLAAAAGLIAALACNREVPGTSGLGIQEYTASLTGVSTRTSLSEGGKVLWDESGESISLIDGSGSCYILPQKSVSADRCSATFSGEAPKSGCKWAVYPAQAEVSTEDGLLYLSIPSEQEAVEDSFGSELNLALAKVSQDNELHFKNVCGLLGFSVDAQDITSLRFSATEKSGGALTGTAMIEYSGDAPDCVSDLRLGSGFVELNGDFSAGERYYALVFPGTYSNLEVTFTDGKGRTATFTKDGQLTVERSKSVVISPFSIAESDWQGGTEPGGTATLSYSELDNPATYLKSYGTATSYKNAYGTWTICAYNKSDLGAFQINYANSSYPEGRGYLGTPQFEAPIKSLIITNKNSGKGNFRIGTSEKMGSSPFTSPCDGAGTFTIDVSSLNVRELYIRSDVLMYISELSVIWGSGEASDPEPDPDPDPDPQPQPDPDPDAKADFGWFELPAQADKNADGIDDDNSDYYYSHTFRADASKIRNFSCCYSKSKKQPVWVAAPMHNCYKGSSGRNDSYKADPNIKCAQTSKVSGYTRGHMLGSSDRTVSKETNRQVFYFSNIGAQLQSGFNTGGGAWNNLELLTDSQWCSDTLYQVIGCIFSKFTDKYGNTVSPKTVDGVQIPTAYYKVLLRTKSGNSGKRVDKCSESELKCAAFIIAHRSNAGHKPSASDMYSVSELEAITGLNYFVNVPNAPKSKSVASEWGL